MKKISVCLEGSIFGPAHSDANGILKVREHVRDQDSHKHINNHQSQPPTTTPGLLNNLCCKHYHKMQFSQVEKFSFILTVHAHKSIEF